MPAQQEDPSTKLNISLKVMLMKSSEHVKPLRANSLENSPEPQSTHASNEKVSSSDIAASGFFYSELLDIEWALEEFIADREGNHLRGFRELLEKVKKRIKESE